MNQLKLNGQSHQASNEIKSSSITPLARLVHTMRQVNKLTGVFAEFYPYRPDNNLTSEKLCFHFYKQLHASIQSFGEQLHFVPVDGMSSVSGRLESLLLNCDKYFSDYNQHLDEQTASKNKAQTQKQASNKSNQVLNVIRTPRTNNNGNTTSSAPVNKVHPKIGKSVQAKKKSSGVSIVSASAIVHGKKVLPKSRMHIIDAKSDEESVVRLPMRMDISPPPPKSSILNVKKNLPPEIKKVSNSSLNVAQNDSGTNNDAFQHLSSPKLKINNFKVNRKSRSAEKMRQNDFSEKMHRANSIERCKF